MSKGGAAMLHTLHLSLPNVFLLTGTRSILVDSGSPGDVPHILDFLKAHQSTNLALIIVTHGHWDHAGGAAELRTATGAPIALHRADVDRVRRGVNGALKPTGLMGSLLRPFLDRGYPPFEPDILIDDEIDLTDFGVAARVVFTPGHTPGSISVRTNDGDLIVGDLLMGGWWGGRLFPTSPGLHYFADSVDEVYASVRKLLAAAPRRIHCGHGGPLEPDRVHTWLNRRCASAILDVDSTRGRAVRSEASH